MIDSCRSALLRLGKGCGHASVPQAFHCWLRFQQLFCCIYPQTSGEGCTVCFAAWLDVETDHRLAESTLQLQKASSRMCSLQRPKQRRCMAPALRCLEKFKCLCPQQHLGSRVLGLWTTQGTPHPRPPPLPLLQHPPMLQQQYSGAPQAPSVAQGRPRPVVGWLTVVGTVSCSVVQAAYVQGLGEKGPNCSGPKLRCPEMQTHLPLFRLHPLTPARKRKRERVMTCQRLPQIRMTAAMMRL